MVRLSDDAVRRANAVGISAILKIRGITLAGRNNLVGPCPRCGGTDRFAVNLSKRLFNCRGCGAKGHGAISLVRFLDGGDFRTAVESIIGQIKVPITNQIKTDIIKVPGPVTDGEYEREQHRKAAFFWSHRRPITGSIGERYLREVRGYTGTMPETLAFLPPSRPGHHPAMIAAFGMCEEPEPGILAPPHLTIADAAVHLTLLKPDGSGKADVKPNKIIIGSVRGRPIVLAPPNDLLGLAITEGIEDALTVHEATGLGAWAAYSASNMPKLADLVPDYIEAVTIYAHDDLSGERNARLLAKALYERSVEVFMEGIAP